MTEESNFNTSTTAAANKNLPEPSETNHTLDPIAITKSSSTQWSQTLHDYTANDGVLQVKTKDAQDNGVSHVNVEVASPSPSATSVYTHNGESPYKDEHEHDQEDTPRSGYFTYTRGVSSAKKKKKPAWFWPRKTGRVLENTTCMAQMDPNIHGSHSSSNSSEDSSSDSDSSDVSSNIMDEDDSTLFYDNISKAEKKITRQPCCSYWTWLTEGVLHKAIISTVQFLARVCATRPYKALILLSILPLIIAAAGFFTNFQLVVDTDTIFTPLNSPSLQHFDWLKHDSGFNHIRPMMMILHANGANILGRDSLQSLFQAINVVRRTPGYDDLCQQGTFVSHDNQHTCRIHAATRFWNHNETLFRQEVKNDTDAIVQMSQETYRDSQTPVFHEMILGNYKMSNFTTIYNATTNIMENISHAPSLHFVQSLVVRLELPDTGVAADEFEEVVLDRLNNLKRHWVHEGRELELDFMSIYAYKIENQRALVKDLPLVGGIVLVLIIFTTIFFSKRNAVESRSLLGCASLLAIGFSLALSYGIMWCIGVPFTSLAQILPFMVMGIGLDDSFIITGAYFRTDPNLSTLQRIDITLEEVGVSITLTTITTMLAMLLGSLSTIPGVRWLCYYAFSAIGANYLYQIIYFVPLLVLDERRLAANRHSCCFWKQVYFDDDDSDSACAVISKASSSSSSSSCSVASAASLNDLDEEEGNATIASANHKVVVTTGARKRQTHFSEKVMIWYGNKLMQPLAKLLVLVIFSVYFGFCVWRTTLLTQEFNAEDYTPADSYLRGTLEALDDYYSLTKPMELYFRFVNQSDTSIQRQMREYVDEMAALPQIGENAPFCWVRDFEMLEEQYPEYQVYLQNLTFNEKINFIMANPTVREIYGEDIVRNEDTGEIEASRCLLFLRNVDLTDVDDQITMLEGQRAVTKSQAINLKQDDYRFFAFDRIFFFWELYAQAVAELSFTIISGVIAVTIVTFVLIPNWTAVFFICPGIIVLYFNFLGTMQWMGLHINSLTYVIICMAIGLLVDFLAHILLRYYETHGATREEKVKETLNTMGASIFVGGLTTFLSVCPLIFSSTHIFMTVFWAFAAIVVLGFTHGLILLPVVLSFIGPIATHHLITQKGAVEERRTDSSSSSSSPSSSSSGEESRFDDEVIGSPTQETPRQLMSTDSSMEKAKEKKSLSYISTSFAEEPDQVISTMLALSPSRSLVIAPSDEIMSASPQDAPSPATNRERLAPTSLLGKFSSDLYSCAADFDFYNSGVFDSVFNSVGQACKSPMGGKGNDRTGFGGVYDAVNHAWNKSSQNGFVDNKATGKNDDTSQKSQQQ